MRTLIVSELITLDGVIEAPGAEAPHPNSGWTVPYGTDETYAHRLQEAQDAGSLLLGRRTYDELAAAWPDAEPGPFAEAMNALPKDVVTTGEGALTWNATALTGDAEDAVRALKDGDGGPILVVGSATLVRMLLARRLVDELRLMVFPVAVGGGLRCWPVDRGLTSLELVDLVRCSSGVTLQTFRPA